MVVVVVILVVGESPQDVIVVNITHCTALFHCYFPSNCKDSSTAPNMVGCE